jgi:hypothetical protein
VSAELADSSPAWPPRTRPSSAPTNVRAVFFALIAAFFFSALIVAVGLVAGVRGDDIACLLLAAVAVMIALIPLCLDVGRPPQRRHIFLSMLAISYIVNFVVPVFTYYIPAEGPMDPAAMVHTNLLPPDVARGQALAILGLLAFYAGYALPVRPLLRPILPDTLYEWSHGTALFATSAWILVGWLVFIGRAVGVVPAALGSGWISGFAISTLYGSAMLTAIYLKYRSRAAMAALVTLVPLTTMVMFTTGSKTRILMPTAMIVVTWIVVQRRIRLRWVVAGLVAIALIYPVAQFWRHEVLQRNSITMVDVARNPGPPLRTVGRFLTSTSPGEYLSIGAQAAGVRLDGLGVVSVVLRDTPRVSPFQNGRTIMLVPIGFIPRLLWPDKPRIPIGNWISKTYTPYGYLSDTNLAVTWIGEFYLNFGLAGVTIGMMVLGLLLRCTHVWLLRPGLSIPLLVASVIILKELLLGVQGSLYVIINSPIISLIPLVLLHMVVRASGGVYPIAANEPSGEPRSPSRGVSASAS